MSNRIFCSQYFVPEQLVGDLERLAIANWNRIPEADRVRCVSALRTVAERSPEMLAKWRDQHARGMRIGSDDIRFHFGVGMSVRNVLRGVLRDGDLPGPIMQRNWDDYYYGALDALVTA